jgi:hypothetical protein
MLGAKNTINETSKGDNYQRLLDGYIEKDDMHNQPHHH